MTGQNGTLAWYRENAADFIARTAEFDMTAHYRPFLAQVPPGGRILEEVSLRALLNKAGGFRETALWITGDARPGREDERWINVLCRAE